MISLQTALILVSIHLVYYFILQVIADIMRAGSVKNTPNKLISKFRTEHHINIKTFQKNTAHYGFAWFKTIYLNESLFRKEKALRFTFFHELYHVQNKHKRNTLLFRLGFSFIPMLLAVSWMIFLPIYTFYAWFMYKINERYERQANEFATKMIENESTNNNKERK